MDVAAFCRQSNVVVVVGKGGVGKTTVTAALARTASAAGLDVLVVALDDGGSLPALFGRSEPFGYRDVVLIDGDPSGAAPSAGGDAKSGGQPLVPGRVRGRLLTPDEALLEYLVDHGLGRVSRRLVQSGALDVVATAIPGVREMLVLARLKQIERAGVADLIVLDAPATGHAVTFLTSSGGLADAARGGPLRSQAEQVVEMLADPARCQVLLVTAPEETPVNEVIETAYRLEDEVGMRLGPVVVNGCFPVADHLDVDPAAAALADGAAPPSPADAGRLAAAARFRAKRQELEAHQLERLEKELPLPLIVLPYLFTAGIGPEEIGALATALGEGIEELS
jgi:anion-transporting  ArsA/GET3 family ATPase